MSHVKAFLFLGEWLCIDLADRDEVEREQIALCSRSVNDRDLVASGTRNHFDCFFEPNPGLNALMTWSWGSSILPILALLLHRQILRVATVSLSGMCCEFCFKVSDQQSNVATKSTSEKMMVVPGFGML